MTAEQRPSKRRVYVVETWLKGQKRWYVWSAHGPILAARSEADDARHRHPGERFRVTRYESTKP